MPNVNMVKKYTCHCLQFKENYTRNYWVFNRDNKRQIWKMMELLWMIKVSLTFLCHARGHKKECSKEVWVTHKVLIIWHFVCLWCHLCVPRMSSGRCRRSTAGGIALIRCLSYTVTRAVSIPTRGSFQMDVAQGYPFFRFSGYDFHRQNFISTKIYPDAQHACHIYFGFHNLPLIRLH